MDDNKELMNEQAVEAGNEPANAQAAEPGNEPANAQAASENKENMNDQTAENVAKDVAVIENADSAAKAVAAKPKRPGTGEAAL